MCVALGFAVFDGDDERVDAGGDVLEVVFGYGQLLPELERAIDGREPGDRVTVSLRAGVAFGPRRPEAVLEIDRDELPEDAAPGDRFEADTPDGGVVVLHVLEVGEDHAVVDTNHPLAGQPVRYELEVQSVRPGSDAELERAQRGLVEAPSDLVPAERLLRGRNGTKVADR